MLAAVVLAQPTPCPNATGPNPGTTIGISNVTYSTLNHNTPMEEGFTVEYDSSGITIPNIGKCETDTVYVTFANGTNMLWVDWNADGDFLDPDEFYFPTTQAGNLAKYAIYPPFHATPGLKIMRVTNSHKLGTDPCAAVAYGGDFEDYKINIVENDMRVDSVVVELAKTCYLPASNCNPVLKLSVYTTGVNNPAHY